MFSLVFVCVLYNVNMIIFSTAVLISPSRGGLLVKNLLPNNTVTAAENEPTITACSYYCFVWLQSAGRIQQTIIERDTHTHTQYWGVLTLVGIGGTSNIARTSALLMAYYNNYKRLTVKYMVYRLTKPYHAPLLLYIKACKRILSFAALFVLNCLKCCASPAHVSVCIMCVCVCE